MTARSSPTARTAQSVLPRSRWKRLRVKLSTKPSSCRAVCIQRPDTQRIYGFFANSQSSRPAPYTETYASACRCPADPTRTATSAKHPGSRAAGAGQTCLCPANRKNGHASAADHVGAAAAYHSDRAIGRKCTASAHGGCTHPARPEATTERIGTHTAGAGPSRLCPASRKGGCPSAIDHARAAARASCCAIRAVDREYATPTHGGCANTLCAKTTPKCANRTGTRPSRLCKASKEIPRRKIVCAG